MALTKVTNKAAGPRGFNAVLSPDGSLTQVMLQPGQTIEIDMAGSAHAVLAGHVRSGDLVVGEPDDDKASADADAILAEAEAKKQAEAAEKEAADVKARNELADKIVADSEKAAANQEQAQAAETSRKRGAKPDPA